jgi:uncharacterized protein
LHPDSRTPTNTLPTSQSGFVGRRVKLRQMQMNMGRVILTLALKDTPTADAIWQAAPFEALANTWGDAVYLRGNAIAIGFGPTPLSEASEIRLPGAANVFATCTDDLRALKTITDGMLVRVECLSK